jgi:hypothetical protein
MFYLYSPFNPIYQSKSMASSSNPQRSIWLLTYGCAGPSIEASELRKYNPSFEADECHTVVADGVTKYTLIHLKKRKQLSFVEKFMAQYSGDNGVAVEKSTFFADDMSSSGLLHHPGFKAMVMKYQESRGAGVEGVFTTWIEQQKLRGGGMIASYCSGLVRGGAEVEEKCEMEEDEEEIDVRSTGVQPDIADLQIENGRLCKELRSATSRLGLVTGVPMVRVGDRMTIPLSAGPGRPEQNIYYYMDQAYKSAMERKEAEDQLDVVERANAELSTKLDVAVKAKATTASSVVSRVKGVMEERDLLKHRLMTVEEELMDVKALLEEVSSERDDLGKKYDELIITMISDGKITVDSIKTLREENAELTSRLAAAESHGTF